MPIVVWTECGGSPDDAKYVKGKGGIPSVWNSEQFKDLTGGDPISWAEKYMPSGSYRPRGNNVFLANNEWVINTDNEGVLPRFIGFSAPPERDDLREITAYVLDQPLFVARFVERLLDECHKAVLRWDEEYADRLMPYPDWMNGDLSPQMKQATEELQQAMKDAWLTHNCLLDEMNKPKAEKTEDDRNRQQADVIHKAIQSALTGKRQDVVDVG